MEKLNSDCNMTAGVEAKLSLADGAQVMLRRNVDTKKGLVNGAVGTVLSISSERIKVNISCWTPSELKRCIGYSNSKGGGERPLLLPSK